MTIFEYGMIFVLCWWFALFLVLPFGNEPPENPEPHHYAAAPAQPRIKRKLIWATGLTIPLSAVVIWIISSGILVL